MIAVLDVPGVAAEDDRETERDEHCDEYENTNHALMIGPQPH